MKITNIKLMMRANLGNYEHTEFSAEAVVAEDESLHEATMKLRNFVDWHVRGQIRVFEEAEKRKIVETAKPVEGQPDAPEVAKAKRWLEVHAARKAVVEAM